MVIQDPSSGDPFLDWLIVLGVSERTLRLIDNDISRYVQSLSRQGHKDRIKIIKAIRKRIPR